MIETMAMKIMAPNNAGKIKMSPSSGPHSPKRLPPIQAPTTPATILPIIPPGKSLPKIMPAIQPIIPPTINVIISPIFLYSPLFLVMKKMNNIFLQRAIPHLKLNKSPFFYEKISENVKLFI